MISFIKIYTFTKEVIPKKQKAGPICTVEKILLDDVTKAF